MEGNQYRDAAGRIVEAVGKDNILSATHCATRLRLIVKDKERIDEKKLQEIGMVKGTFFNAGQYQIILGTGIVNKVYGEMEGLGLNTLSKQEQDELVKNQQKGVKRMMRMLGDIFIPIIPVIAATGLFLGLKGCVFNDNVLGLLGLSASIIPDYVVTLVNVLTETAFAFLPALICWSAFKVFGGTPVIGLVIGLMLVSPQPSQRICGGYSWQRRGGSDGIFTHPHCRLSGKRSDSYPGSVSGGFHGKKAEKNYAQCPGSDYDSLSGDAGNISGGDAGNRPRHACGGA